MAFDAVKAGRVERGKASGSSLPDKFDINDHLTALKARVAPIKKDFADVMSACVNTCRALYPEHTDARSTSQLVGMLNESKEWLQLWRSSSACAGADAALMLIMSWHEDIKLAQIQS